MFTTKENRNSKGWWIWSKKLDLCTLFRYSGKELAKMDTLAEILCKNECQICHFIWH